MSPSTLNSVGRNPFAYELATRRENLLWPVALRTSLPSLTRIQTSVAADGRLVVCLPNRNGNFRQLALFHDSLAKFAGRPVNVEINFESQPDPAIQIFSPDNKDKPICVFHVDKNGPYFRPHAGGAIKKGQDARRYPIELAPIGAKEVPEFEGISLFRGRSDLNLFVYAVWVDGELKGFLNSRIERSKLAATFPVYDDQKKLTGRSIGAGTVALYSNGITGITGPIVLQSAKDGCYRLETDKKIYYFSPEEARALKIDPQKREVWLRLEKGMPTAVFGPQDANFKSPFYLTLFRDEMFELFASATAHLRSTNLGGIVFVEGAETVVVCNEHLYRTPREVVNIQNSRHIIAALGKEETFRPRRVSVLLADNSALLFVTDGARFDAGGKAVSRLVIAAYKNLINGRAPAEKNNLVIRQLKELAEENNTVRLKKLGEPQVRTAATVSDHGSLSATDSIPSLMHPSLRTLKGKAVEIIIYTSSLNLEIEVCDLLDPFTSLSSFRTIDGVPCFSNGPEEMLYPAVSDTIKIGGREIRLYKKNAIGKVGPVYLAVKSGKVTGVLNAQLKALPYQPIMDKERNITGLVIGTSVVTPFETKINGYFGPLLLFTREGKYYFPYRHSVTGKSYYLSETQLTSIGVNPQDEKKEIYALFEGGMPVAVFNSNDQAFDNPVLFTTIRNAERKLAHSTAGIFKDLDLPAIALIENLPTHFQPGKHEVLASVSGHAYPIAYLSMASTKDNYVPRQASIVIAENQFILFANGEKRFDEMASQIATLAIRAFLSLEPEKKKEGAKRIRKLADAAYAVHKAGDKAISERLITYLNELIDKINSHTKTPPARAGYFGVGIKPNPPSPIKEAKKTARKETDQKAQAQRNAKEAKQKAALEAKAAQAKAKEEAKEAKIKAAEQKAIAERTARARALEEARRKEAAAAAEEQKKKGTAPAAIVFKDTPPPGITVPKAYSSPTVQLAHFDLRSFLLEAEPAFATQQAQRALKGCLAQLCEPYVNGELSQYEDFRRQLRFMVRDEITLNQIYSVLLLITNLVRLKGAILKEKTESAKMDIYLIGKKLREVLSPALPAFETARPKLTAGPIDARMQALSEFCRSLMA